MILCPRCLPGISTLHPVVSFTGCSSQISRMLISKAVPVLGIRSPELPVIPLSRGGPWMRIDYVFGDKEWEPVWCITEKRRPLSASGGHGPVSPQGEVTSRI